MWGILKNDFYTSKKTICTTIITLLLHTALFCIKIPSSALEEMVTVLLLNAGYFFLSFMIFIVFGNLLTSILSQNEQAGWQTFVATTKTGRKGYITQKYIFAIVMYGFAALYVIFVNEIAYKINGVHVRTTFVVLFLIFFVFQATLELPCMLRFGTVYGGYIKIVLMLTALFGVIIYGLYGDVQIFNEQNQEKMLDWALHIMREGLNGPTAKKGLLIAGIVTAILYGVSYEIALLTRKKS